MENDFLGDFKVESDIAKRKIVITFTDGYDFIIFTEWLNDLFRILNKEFNRRLK